MFVIGEKLYAHPVYRHQYLLAGPHDRAVCGRWLGGILGSNPTGGIDVCLL